MVSRVTSILVCVVLIIFFNGINCKTFKPCELAKILLDNEVKPEDVSTWLCIARYESYFNSSAIGHMSYDGSLDHGIFQINDKYWCTDAPDDILACGISCTSLRDDNLADDIACAKRIFKQHTRIDGNGWSAWAVYPYYCTNKEKNDQRYLRNNNCSQIKKVLLPSLPFLQQFPSSQPLQSFPSTQTFHSSSSAQPLQPFPSSQPLQSFPSSQTFHSSSSAQPLQPFPSSQPLQSFPSTQTFHSSSSAQPLQPFPSSQPFQQFPSSQSLKPFTFLQPLKPFPPSQTSKPFLSSQVTKPFPYSQPFKPFVSSSLPYYPFRKVV